MGSKPYYPFLLILNLNIMNPMNFIINYVIAKNRAEHYNVADQQKIQNTALMTSMIVDNPMMNYLLIESQAKNAPVAAPPTTATSETETKINPPVQQVGVSKAAIKKLELTAANKDFTVYVDVQSQEQNIKEEDTKTEQIAAGETKPQTKVNEEQISSAAQKEKENSNNDLTIEGKANGKSVEKDIAAPDKAVNESSRDMAAEKLSDSTESNKNSVEDLSDTILKISKSLETINTNISKNNSDINELHKEIVPKVAIDNFHTEKFNNIEDMIKSLGDKIENLTVLKNSNVKPSK
jgi:hypothetical protein